MVGSAPRDVPQVLRYFLGAGGRGACALRYQKEKNLEKAGRLLVYSKLDRAIQEHIDDARRAEWANI